MIMGIVGMMLGTVLIYQAMRFQAWGLALYGAICFSVGFLAVKKGE